MGSASDELYRFEVHKCDCYNGGRVNGEQGIVIYLGNNWVYAGNKNLGTICVIFGKLVLCVFALFHFGLSFEDIVGMLY